MRLNDINIKQIFTRVCDDCQKSGIFLTPTWNIRAKKRVFFLFTKVLQENRVPVGSKKRVNKEGVNQLHA